VQLHLQPSGAVEEVLPEIGLYFTNHEPERAPTILRLGSQGIDIPPGESRYVIRDSYLLPADVQLLAIQPHAHYRAKEIRGTATFPDGTSRLVMHIKDWDFRWQHVYREETPIPLPKGTRLSMEYTYDNSSTNVRNPELPPARVYWGQRSRDEMGDLWFQLLASNDRDRARLSAEITAKMTGEDIVGYETMLKVNPKDAELHDDVALLYMGLGFAANAVRHFQASAVIKPESAAAHFNLGTAYAQAGRFDDSIKSFREALARRPDYALAHGNLGRVLLIKGDVGGALGEYQEAVRIDPNNPQNLLGLSECYAARGAFDLALEAIERALKLPLNEGLAKEIFAKRAEYQKRRAPNQR
jgi:tetratricopeptide (TPR) repeat protein